MPSYLDREKAERRADREAPPDCGCGYGQKCITHVQHHEAPAEFRREYLRQYELRDQRTLMGVTQEQMKTIRLTHGDPATASEPCGPPKDLRQQVKVMAERFAERRRAMMELLRPRVAPPAGEETETAEPWQPLPMSREEAVAEERRRATMRAELVRAAFDRGEITDKQLDDFQREGTIPAGRYEPQDEVKP